MSGPSDTSSTRRELLRQANRRRRDEDAEALAHLLGLERLAIGVYDHALRAAPIAADARRLVRHLRDQERSHAEALARLAPDAGGRRPHGRRGIESALARLGIDVGFATLRTERDWFTLLERLESALESAYYEAILRISAPQPATLVAQILASEAQHWTLLIRLRHPPDITLAVVGLLQSGAANS